MLYIFKFPDIGEGVTEGKILEWFVKKGQQIAEGDPVVKMETDKVVADIPTPKGGTVRNTFGKIGQIVNVGDALVEIEIEAEAAVEKEKVPIEEKAFGVVGTIEDSGSDAFLPSTGEGFEEKEAARRTAERRRALATPVARKMARDLGVDINDVRGSGPAGRVMKADVQRAFEEKRTGLQRVAKPAEASVESSRTDRFEFEELSQIRKTIAARMVESKATVPHATSLEEVEVSRLIRIRADAKTRFADQNLKLTYMPFIIRAVVSALGIHPKLNCRLDMQKNRVVYNRFYNIGFAADTPDGLMVPVIKDADKKSIRDLAQELQDKSERARQRKLALDELRDSTFTVTNYGSVAGLYGVPIINYPNVAILGIGRIHEKPVVRDGNVVIGSVLPLSLTVDHRIVDGGDAGRFMKDLIAFLADPVSMLLL